MCAPGGGAPRNDGMASDLIIFDCDGVLIDSELIACRVSANCLSEIGMAITVEEIVERYVGISATAMFADWQPELERPCPWASLKPCGFA